MGFFSDLGSTVLNSAREWSEEANEYYREGMSMRPEELREELLRVKRHPSNKAKLVGYSKAAKDRNIS